MNIMVARHMRRRWLVLMLHTFSAGCLAGKVKLPVRPSRPEMPCRSPGTSEVNPTHYRPRRRMDLHGHLHSPFRFYLSNEPPGLYTG